MTEERLKQIEQALTVGGPFGSDPTFAKATVRDLAGEVRCLQTVADERQKALDRLRVLADAAVDAAEIVRQWHANPRPAAHWKPFLEEVDAYRAAASPPREEPCSDAYVAGLLAEARCRAEVLEPPPMTQAEAEARGLPWRPFGDCTEEARTLLETVTQMRDRELAKSEATVCGVSPRPPQPLGKWDGRRAKPEAKAGIAPTVEEPMEAGTWQCVACNGSGRVNIKNAAQQHLNRQCPHCDGFGFLPYDPNAQPSQKIDSVPTVVEVTQEGNPRPELTDAGETEFRVKWEPATSASREAGPRLTEDRGIVPGGETVETLAPYVKRLEGRVAHLEARLTADADEEQVLSALSEMHAAFLRRFETIEAEAAVVSRYVSGLTARVDALESQEAAPYGRAEFDCLKQLVAAIQRGVVGHGGRITALEPRVQRLAELAAAAQIEATADTAAPPTPHGATALLARVRAFLADLKADAVALPLALQSEAKALREALG